MRSVIRAETANDNSFRHAGTDEDQEEVLVRCCLINPSWHVRKGNIWSQIRATMPSLGLLYLAATLEREGIAVTVIDFQAEILGWEGMESRLQRETFDIYGITVTTPLAHNAYRLARLIKKHHPSAMVVLGGVHATSLPEEALACDAVDYVVRGEGEEVFLRLVRGDPPEHIHGLSYRAEEGIRHQGPDGLINDLDTLPFPAFHLVNLDLYRPAVGSYKRLPAINITTTRGCPGKCTFCNSADIKLRKRSAELIFADMVKLSQQYGRREIAFYDDTFTVFPSNIKKLCDLLQKNAIDLTWSCFARVDCVSRDLLISMKKGGCHQIMFGIESSNETILNNIKKPMSLEKNHAVVRMAQEAGLTVRCTFMFGNPGETEETVEQTIKYAIKLDPDIAVFNVTTPYPGTELFAWAKAGGYLLTENWDDYDLSRTVMQLPSVSPEYLEASLRTAYRKFYQRPSTIWRKVKRLSSWSELINLVQGGASLVKYMIAVHILKNRNME
ncbi:MAG: cobalamin-dependent protein [Magnetococcales bacterium]|nr:cobalamin-dependent protein [Magnetococcales bacterium]MBF0322056.1 cobalamin-dependent protein [Magnetococcales bacterium]